MIVNLSLAYCRSDVQQIAEASPRSTWQAHLSAYQVAFAVDFSPNSLQRLTNTS